MLKKIFIKKLVGLLNLKKKAHEKNVKYNKVGDK